jgi:hypothetical protein
VLAVCSAASCRVHLRQPCSTSVSKGTIGWHVLKVASSCGSVDYAFDGKCVALHFTVSSTLRLVRYALAMMGMVKAFIVL